MVMPYSGIATPCTLNSMFIQMHLVPEVVKIIGAFVGFSLNGVIIS